MRIHILGICGSFMGAIALLAKQLGHTVSGADQNVYPPMSDTLRHAGIDIIEGYDPKLIPNQPDLILIGNTLKRSNPAVEYVLNKGLRYLSGSQWLSENILTNKHVLVVTGTHGKTTTSSMLAWILSVAGLTPGFLIGGQPLNFGQNAMLGQGDYFVIEGDEYGTAFFDTRSKFMHYRPRTLIINNLEFDHADFFENLDAIKKQFQNLLTLVPSAGAVIYPDNDKNIDAVIKRGCWSAKQTFSVSQQPQEHSATVWQAKNIQADGSQFELCHRDQKLGVVRWQMLGMHNIHNALAAVTAAHEIGVPGNAILKALNSFTGIKRRLEVRGQANGITVYDDFAHHPTAILHTLEGLRAHVKQQRIFAVLQFGSHTMRNGYHREQLARSLKAADQVLLLQPEKDNVFVQNVAHELGGAAHVFDHVDGILHFLTPQLKNNDHVIIMSSRGFDGIHQKLLDRLQTT